VIRAAGVVFLAASTLAAAPQLYQRDVYLMGTQARLAVYAPDRPRGIATLETALAALERTERQLSTWQQNSPISRLNRTPTGHRWRAEESLCALFADLYEWQHTTGGTFDPAIGALTAAWKIHEDGALPTDLQLDDARQRSGLQHFDFDRQQCTITRRTDVTLDVGAFGKGEALDRAARALSGTAWMIDLGGQVAVGGTPPDGKPWIVALAHPADRQRVITNVPLSAGSLSTSGGSERDLRVGRTRVGHILDPRTGRPTPFEGSVVVWHERALVADILSTALYVMGPEAGLPWAASRGFAAAYLIPEGASVRVTATPDFTIRLKPNTTSPE
jgi:thiamine biosynthesis lipoprotein